MAHVLVIEDNPANLELMVYLLEAFGHTPLSATNGRAGLAAARLSAASSVAPDLVLCDIQLPDLSGHEVARQLRADPALAAVPLVAVTASAMPGDRDKALAAGFSGYITKPLEPETFVQQVEAFLPQRQRSSPVPDGAAPPAGDAPRLPAPDAGPTAPKARLLVVDDAPVNLELLRGILEPSGYAVQTAGSMPEALALARGAPPDLVISDLMMPTAGGYDLLRAFKSDPQLSPIPVIIHSASAATAHDQAAALALGAARFVPRPIEPDHLLREVEACLAWLPS